MRLGAVDKRLPYRRCGALLILVSACMAIPFLWKTPRSNRELLNDGLTALLSGDQEGLRTAMAGLTRSGGKAERAILDSQVALLNSEFQQAITLSWTADRLAAESLDYTLPIRVEALYRSDQSSVAEDYAREWLQRHTDHPGAHRWLASIYYDLGAMDLARTHLKSLIRLKPSDYRPYYLLGILFHDYERFPEAAASFQRLLKLADTPESIVLEATLRLGDCYIQDYQYSLALELLRPLTGSATALARCAKCEYL